MVFPKLPNRQSPPLFEVEKGITSPDKPMALDLMLP
jgi:hypothetical protein